MRNIHLRLKPTPWIASDWGGPVNGLLRRLPAADPGNRGSSAAYTDRDSGKPAELAVNRTEIAVNRTEIAVNRAG